MIELYINNVYDMKVSWNYYIALSNQLQAIHIAAEIVLDTFNLNKTRKVHEMVYRKPREKQKLLNELTSLKTDNGCHFRKAHLLEEIRI